MKRLVIVSTLVLTLVILAVWGDRIAGRALDAQLGPLLSRELGLPVTLAPIQARLFKLGAGSPKLVMGDPEDPAVVAHDVEVTLALSDLLKGEIRLVSASASDLMVRPDRWPGSDSPLPENYLFLDPWLPRRLQLQKGQFVTDTGDGWPVQQFLWRRKLGGSATLDWTEQRAGGEVALSATLKSLQALLRLSPVALDLNMAVTGKDDTAVALQTEIKPGKASGYTLSADIQAAGMNAHIVASHAAPWQLPDQSTSKIDRIEANKLRALIGGYTGSAPEPQALLASALPELDFPHHQGSVAIDDIRLGDEALTDTSFDFAASAQGLKLSSLTAKGPAGIVHGAIDIVSSGASWQLNLTADIEALDADTSLAPQYLNANWLWNSGHTSLAAQGETWGALLNSMEGAVTLNGLHRGETKTPVKINGHLDTRPGVFGLDQLAVEFGSGRLSGSMALSGTTPRKLTVDLKAQQLELDPLFEGGDDTLSPGIAIPEYLAVLPGIELSWKLDVKGLQAPGIKLATALITLERTPERGALRVLATGTDSGKLDLRLDASTPPGKPGDVKLLVDIDQLNFPELFQQQVALDSRSTGTISLESRGKGIKEIFKALHGNARLQLDFRSDDNWQRASTAEEQVQFSGDAQFVIQDNRILGIEVGKLDIDSIQQDLTGDMSLAAGRTPWLIADLESENLDINGLLAWLPESTGQADQTDSLKAIRDLGSMRLSLDAQLVLMPNAKVSDLTLEVSSSAGALKLEQLDFTFEGNPLKSHGEIIWQGKRAGFSGVTRVTDFNLDRFLIRDPSASPVPVSGSVKLASEGSSVAELLAGLNGDVSLAATDPQAAASLATRRKLEMNIRRLADGMHADISSAQWGESELSGSVRFLNTAPPLLEVEVSGGSLSLLPWQQAVTAPAKKDAAKKGAPGTITRAARSSADMVGRVLLSPTRLFSGPGEAAPGDKYFSSTPLPFDALNKYNAKIHGKIASLSSLESVVEDLEVTGTLTDGQLAFQVNAGKLNQGTAELQLDVNARTTPPVVELTSSLHSVRGASGKPSYPRSGFMSVKSTGRSPADLAASLNGQMYLELGRGPYDYRNAALLNADVATRMFQALIPGLERRPPEMECGVTLVTFKDGVGITPYGFAARTREANLLGRVEVDLTTEMLQLEFDSRSREGVGISVGSVFANSVRIQGPLTNPKIAPKTTSILARGWAAFMTAGLSVVGESVLKRVLSSENPCKSLQETIRKDLCSSDLPAASSPLVCPRT